MPPPAQPEAPNTFGGSVVIASSIFSVIMLTLLFGYVLIGPIMIAIVMLLVVGTAFGYLHWWLWGRSMSDDKPEERQTIE